MLEPHLPFSPPPSLFEEFQTLSPAEPHAIIRFFERYEADMELVPPDEAFVMRFHYANALFAVEAFWPYLELCDEIIETSMIHNWDFIENQDVFLLSLEQKACAHLALGHHVQALKLVEQLHRIRPAQTRYAKLLRRVWVAKRPRWVLEGLAVSLWLGIFGLSMVLGNILFFEAFFPELAQFFAYTAYAAFGLASLLLFIGGFGQFYWVERHHRSK